MNVDSFSIKDHIRTIPDWPKPGIMFRDITSLLANKLVYRRLIDSFVHRYFNVSIDAVVGIDARGFIIGAPLAYELNASFIPVRKKGKLPGATISEPYSLEYGEDIVEMQEGSLQPEDKVILVDDLIATGGTMIAATKLIQRQGAEIIEATAIIDLPDIGGSQKLLETGVNVYSFCQFEGE